MLYVIPLSGMRLKEYSITINAIVSPRYRSLTRTGSEFFDDGISGSGRVSLFAYIHAYGGNLD